MPSGKIAWLVSHPGFRRHPLRTSARVALWELHRLRGRPTSLPFGELTLRARPEDGLGRLVCYFGDAADELLGFLRGYLRPGDVVVDVGANIGTHALLASRLVGPAGAVEAIEADPETCALLAQNVRANGAANVAIRSLGLADVTGPQRFRVRRNSARNSLVDAAEDAIEIPCDRLDNLMPPPARIDLLKIDVEGADLRVLRGAERLFRASPPAIVAVEVISDRLAIARFLRGFDYELCEYRQSTGRLHPATASAENLVAVHPAASDRVAHLRPRPARRAG